MCVRESARAITGGCMCLRAHVRLRMDASVSAWVRACARMCVRVRVRWRMDASVSAWVRACAWVRMRIRVRASARAIADES
jgi:hypothetical protein